VRSGLAFGLALAVRPAGAVEATSLIVGVLVISRAVNIFK
jgi:hypothetical protein